MARAKAAQAAERVAEARTEAQRAAAPAKDAADATKPPPPPLANAAEDPAKDAADPAAPPPVKVRKPYTITKQRERWTDAEHQRFIEALDLYGRQWRKIEEYVGTKTAVQIRSHAQKFFSKLEKEGHTSGSMVTRNGIGFSIPPPRPKKRPAHPYPKKAGNTGKAAEAAKKARKAAPAPAPPAAPAAAGPAEAADPAAVERSVAQLAANAQKAAQTAAAMVLQAGVEALNCPPAAVPHVQQIVPPVEFFAFIAVQMLQPAVPPAAVALPPLGVPGAPMPGAEAAAGPDLAALFAGFQQAAAASGAPAAEPHTSSDATQFGLKQQPGGRGRTGHSHGSSAATGGRKAAGAAANGSDRSSDDDGSGSDGNQAGGGGRSGSGGNGSNEGSNENGLQGGVSNGNTNSGGAGSGGETGRSGRSSGAEPQSAHREGTPSAAAAFHPPAGNPGAALPPVALPGALGANPFLPAFPGLAASPLPGGAAAFAQNPFLAAMAFQNPMAGFQVPPPFAPPVHQPVAQLVPQAPAPPAATAAAGAPPAAAAAAAAKVTAKAKAGPPSGGIPKSKASPQIGRTPSGSFQQYQKAPGKAAL